VVAQVILEMRQRWQQGECPPAELILAQYPVLALQPETAIDLIYEEVCLRQDAGLIVDEADVLRRFPQWRTQLEVLLRCDRILTARSVGPSFPAVGDTVGDFRLVAELGRGTHGRVFLATQPSLGDRPVVLKVTPRDGSEHLSLARLQHTHIVPLYTVQEDPKFHLRLLCMPYFGGITLARILEIVRDRSNQPATGRQIVKALDVAPQVPSAALSSVGSVRDLLSQLSYVQAICWMGTRLADALEYAHERGLVHLDLKPSNVLWAADGLPMLLDFHLAQEPLHAGQSGLDWLGGTYPYMSPEQNAALAAVAQGRGIPTEVGRRSDIYSLGMLLYEALGGHVRQGDRETRIQGARESGPDQRASSPCHIRQPLQECNPSVSTELADLIHKCLAERPEDRYPTAAALATDLRRHLNDLPLDGVRTRRLSERWHKWRRRRPHMLPLAGMLLLVLVAAVAVGISAFVHVRGQRDEVRSDLALGQEQCRQRHFEDAVHTLQRGLNIAESLPFHQDLALALANQLRLATDEQAAAEHAERRRALHRQADAIRFHSVFEDLPPVQVQALTEACGQWWQQRHLLLETLPGDGNPEDKVQLQRDLLDLAIIGTDLQVRLTGSKDLENRRRQALAWLDEAEALLGPQPILAWERRAIRGRADPSPAPMPQTAWECVALGRMFLRSQNAAEALRHLQQAVKLQPNGLWPNFFLGICAYRLEKWEEAILAFTACIPLAADNAICFYNRGLAYTAWKRPDRALADYDTALRLDPTFAAAALNRGILHLQADRYSQAIADLERAVANGANPATGHYNLALVYLKQRQHTRAQENLTLALRHDPNHPDAQALADQLARDR
jgi:serine/threonine protein kinase/Tfp pilus assembly protein PilF